MKIIVHTSLFVQGALEFDTSVEGEQAVTMAAESFRFNASAIINAMDPLEQSKVFTHLSSEAKQLITQEAIRMLAGFIAKSKMDAKPVAEGSNGIAGFGGTQPPGQA